MTKALQLARSFHARRAPGGAGRVREVPAAPVTGSPAPSTRSTAFPEPREPGYAEALLDIVRRERSTSFVPVSSPAASVPDARRAATARRRVRRAARRRRHRRNARRQGRRSPRSRRRSGCGCPTPTGSPIRGRSSRVRLPCRAGPTSSSASPTTRSAGLDLTPLSARDARAQRRLRPRHCRSPRTTRGSCRSSSTARSTAPTPRCATAACRSTAAASRRRSRSTTHTSTIPRSGAGSSISSPRCG